MSRLGRLLSFVFLGAALLLTAVPGEADQPRLTADSLQTLLEQALEAFGQSDFGRAADLFQRIQREFGAEPEFKDPNFLRRMLPLRGHAELAAGQPSAAAQTLGPFVDAFPQDAQHAAALYALAVALRQDGQAEAAATRFAQFEHRYPGRPEMGLALLQRAEILFALNRAAEAIELLEDFSTGPAAAALRNQARLRAVRLLLEQEDVPAAARLLLDFRWDVQTLPEISVLAFTALDLGDHLVEAEDPEAALRAYRLVLPRDRLLAMQKERVLQIRQNLRRAGNGARGFWHDYYRNLLEGLTRQLAALEEGEDFTPFLLLRRGQALLLAERNREAWLLFERLALDEDLPSPTREEAHYRWILAASNLQHWEEALTIARNFDARYPEAELAPQALYLIAQAHQEQRRYAEGTEVLTDLLARFPSHPLAQRWRFTRGFNLTLMEEFPQARSDFQRAVDDFPEGNLTPNAQLWHALTHFFEKTYEEALEEFDQLAEGLHEHPLRGEILYRRAATLYAMREYERAEKEAAVFVREFEGHQRHPEALVLLGDIRMGAGALDEADEAFATIEPENGHLFLYGLFQRGKILRARAQYDGIIDLFSHYVDRTDMEEKPRLSEALYWIGWAHAQREDPAKAVPFFLTALERHGDDPAAGEISSILGLMERLHPHLPSDGANFSAWLEEQRREALVEDRLTYFSRLNLHLATLKRREKLPFQAEALLFEVANEVAMERLGPDALGHVGALLVEKELADAEEYLLRLLKAYPDAPERALAYHGLGKWHGTRGSHGEAFGWLRRFLNETATHEKAGEVMLLAGEALLHLERPDEAAEQFEEILRLRNLRGRPHATALMGLARAMQQKDEPEKAIAYYQRVYTVHRAQPDLVAEAYWTSAILFEELGDPVSARRSLEEMLLLPELTDFPQTTEARERLESLPRLIPPVAQQP